MAGQVLVQPSQVLLGQLQQVETGQVQPCQDQPGQVQAGQPQSVHINLAGLDLVHPGQVHLVPRSSSPGLASRWTLAQ